MVFLRFIFRDRVRLRPAFGDLARGWWRRTCWRRGRLAGCGGQPLAPALELVCRTTYCWHLTASQLNNLNVLTMR
jgi:hypothetical protein